VSKSVTGLNPADDLAHLADWHFEEARDVGHVVAGGIEGLHPALQIAIALLARTPLPAARIAVVDVLGPTVRGVAVAITDLGLDLGCAPGIEHQNRHTNATLLFVRGDPDGENLAVGPDGHALPVLTGFVQITLTDGTIRPGNGADEGWALAVLDALLFFRSLGATSDSRSFFVVRDIYVPPQDL
jgi:hypothetical protein